MPWHKFKENILYPREEVIAECERRIDSRAVETQIPHVGTWGTLPLRTRTC